MHKTYPVHLLALVALLVGFLVYFPGLSGSFVFDDLASISNNPRIAIRALDFQSLKSAALSVESGPLMRPVSMLSFALNHYFTGYNPFYFKLTNILIHCLNGIGIYVITLQILSVYRQRFQPALNPPQLAWISLAVSCAWLLHPLNLTSVLYVVQRMTSLSAFFSIWAIAFFIGGRNRLQEGKNHGVSLILLSILVLTPLAVFSKESGALTPLFMLSIELILFRFQATALKAKKFIAAFFLITVALPALAALSFWLSHPDWLSEGYAIRAFSLSERLMTEARIVWIYIQQILVPVSSRMGLFHDDIAISKGLLQPASTIISIAALGALGVIAYLSRKKAPLFTLGILFFFAGHLLESTVYPLELMHEHRNYLPMYGLLLPTFFYLLNPLTNTISLSLRLLIAGLFLLLFAFSTFSRATTWQNHPLLFQTEAEHHPNSVRSNLGLAALLHYASPDNPEVKEQYDELAAQIYQKISAMDPDNIQGPLGLIMLSTARCKPIQLEWLKNLAFRLEHAILGQGVGSQLKNLVTAQADQKCKLPGTEISQLIESALRNPRLSVSQRADILLAKSHYLINVAGDGQAALRILHQVVETDPGNLKNRMTLIMSLIPLGQLNEAREQLDILARFDKLGIYDKEIGSLRAAYFSNLSVNPAE